MAEAGDMPSDLADGDEISIDGTGYTVVDVTTEDIAITEVVAVSLVSEDNEQWAIEWATHSETANLVAINGEEEREIEVTDVVIQS